MFKDKLFDKTYRVGLWLLACSLLIFTIPLLGNFNEDSNFGFFLLNFACAVTYFIIIVSGGKLKRKGNGSPHITLFLLLSLVSAYSLNRTMSVFEDSVSWFCLVLVIVSVAYFFFSFFKQLPDTARYILMFTIGIGFAVFLYLSVYLFPLYGISLILALGIGLSLHSFVPLMFVAFTGVYLYRLFRQSRKYLFSFCTGIGVCLLAVAISVSNWNSVNEKVNSRFQQVLLDDENTYPVWVAVAKVLPRGNMTEKYLKSGLVYTVPEENTSWGLPSRTFDEVRKHDPLVFTSAFFIKPPFISETDRLKMLEVLYDARHKTQERLWSGDKLRTDYVLTNVKIWPAQRVAYTEKIVTVYNEETEGAWPGRQEAIYTFYLPEGSVVTSLSLWINGKEEKGILTTKSKAQKAYKQIVGVESRDPSVIHWQEGNTVSVRVFPVMSRANRIFKIGVTTPLTRTGDELVYENVYFRGPDATRANETIQLQWVKEPQSFSMSDEFELREGNKYIRRGKYNPGWNLKFRDEGFENSAFSFDSATYTVQHYAKERIPTVFKRVYVDVNCLWTYEEFDEIYEMMKGKEMYVFDGMVMKEVNSNNKNMLFHLLKAQRFSLFPFYEIQDADSSLVITKGNSAAPNLKDLKGSDYFVSLEKKLKEGARYKLFNIGTETSPLIKTLREYRCFDYEKGGLQLLGKLIANKVFVKNAEDENHVVINNAELMLAKTALDTTAKQGSDHIMRLFAYNHIMQQSGRKAFANPEVNDTLVEEARAAYVVSPLSSLIVLESQADYDRFDITKSKTSLENASMKGAVPEPHEWALIIIALVLMASLIYRERINKMFLRK